MTALANLKSFFADKKNLGVLSILLLFLIVYLLITVPNHLLFRTYALDQGMLNNALYDFAHFKNNTFTLGADGSSVNYFGDHFSPIMYLYVPFYYVFGQYALLIIQILSLLFGGFGVYKLAKLKLKDELQSQLILFQFFCIWGIYSALSFDFHNNVVGAMFVPWLLYCYFKKEKRKVLLCFVLIIIAKENMALWLGFIFIGLLVFRFKEIKFREALTFEIPLIVFSFAYFLAVTGYIMPYLSEGVGVDQMSRYGQYGDSIWAIIKNLITHPSKINDVLFVNTTKDPLYDGIKQELHLMFIVSGGLFILFRPSVLIMLIPIYFQKLLSDNPSTWGICFQYSIELVPLISIGLIFFLSTFKNRKLSIAVLLLTIAGTVYINYSKIELRKYAWFDNTNTIFYRAKHFETKMDLAALKTGIEHVPEEVSLSVNSELAPRLAFRDKIYFFPNIKDAQYIVLMKDHVSGYPMTFEQYQQEITKYRQDKKWDLYYENNAIIIFKRK